MNELDEIKQRVKIIDICSKQGIKLAKRGKNYVGLCPFHSEKTGSFTINDDENFYKCFGCQSGGDVIEFYKQLFKIDYASAIRELKGLAGIETSYQVSERVFQKRKIYDPSPDIDKLKECLSSDELYLFEERLGIVNEDELEAISNSVEAAIRAVRQFRLGKNKEIFFELYYYCLKSYSKDKAFLNYLINNRRLSEYSIEIFDLFFIGNYFEVNNHLKKLFELEDLQRSGLYNEKGNLIFYNHRIIIPYKHKNEIVYLRGRYFDSDCNSNTDQFKYLGLKNDELNLNTPKRFFNSDVLNGMIEGRHLYITEGEFDAMIMTELGYKTIGIAGVGNVPSDKWLKKLLKYKIIVCPDRDEAGKQLEKNLNEKFSHLNKEIFIKEFAAKDATELVRMCITN